MLTVVHKDRGRCFISLGNCRNLSLITKIMSAAARPRNHKQVAAVLAATGRIAAAT